MQTPEFQEIRRMTRNALSEIPTHFGVLAVVREGRRPLNNNLQNTLLAESTNFIEGNIPTSFLSPTPSPDEMIIRQRGRKKIPITFSPDIDELKRSRPSSQKDRTPVKQPSSPNTSSSIVLRSTPRKRLLYSDEPERLTNGNSDQSLTKSSPKKVKLEYSMGSSYEEISNSLKACTSNQLISVIEKLLSKCPEIEKDLKDVIPQADLGPLEVHLMYLKRNICQALPVSRLCSKTDAIAYRRAVTHLLNFKKNVIDHGRRFVDCKQWSVVMDYVIMAWRLVRMLPVFDNPSHNLPRRQCFKFLASQGSLSLKSGNFSIEELSLFESKMKSFASDSDEIKPILAQLGDKLKK